MIRKSGLIIYRGQDSINNESFLNSFPYRMEKHNLGIHSIRLDEKILLKLRNRKHLQNIRLTFSEFVQTNRCLIKSLAHMPSLKKLAFQIDISEAGDSEMKIAVLIKKLFAHAKRIIDLQITLFDLVAIDSEILKQTRKLKKLANLKIIVQELSTPDLSCLSDFVSSPSIKKALAHLQSFNIDLSQEKHLQHTSAKFREFSESVAKINSSLQSYFHPKSSLHFDAVSSKSTVPIFLMMLDSSPHLISLEIQLNITQDYTGLFDRLETLNHLSSLSLTFQGYSTRLPQCWKNFGKIFVNLKELDFFLTNSIQDVNIVNYIFIDALRFAQNLRHLSLKFDIANFDIDSFYLLAESISSLSKLQSLKMGFYTHAAESFPDGSRIPGIFKALGSLESLRVLHITFSHLGEYLDNKAFLVLYNALENLLELKELKIDTQHSYIDNQAVIKLAKILPKLGNLENIHINLRFGIKMANETLMTLLTSLASLKHLRSIDLSLPCFQIELSIYETVILLLNKLKSLCFCKVKFVSAKKNPKVESKFQELLKKQHQYQDVCEFSF